MTLYKKITLTVVIIIAAIGCAGKKTSTDHPDQLLLISFDGFRYDYLSKTDTPNFDAFVKEGVQADGLIPVFPTKTFPNHYSIATGLFPANSGLVGNTMYDPKFEEWYRIGDRNAVENAKWYSGEPIWNTVEKQALKAGTMFWVGSEAPIQNMRPTHWKLYDGDMPYKARIDAVIKWMRASDKNRVDFATLYFEHVDMAGHEFGMGSDSLLQAIRKSDQLLGYLKQQLKEHKLWSSTNIIIVSDHGMVDLAADKLIRLDSIIDMDDLERIIWAPTTMIQPKKGRLDSVYQALKKNENHYRVYKKEELPERYHYRNHRRIFDLIMIAEPGYTILDEEYQPKFLASLPRATHGYGPYNKKMHAFFAARGPAFKQGEKIDSFQNIHLYELMTHLLSLKPAPNDGSLDSVSVMLDE